MTQLVYSLEDFDVQLFSPSIRAGGERDSRESGSSGLRVPSHVYGWFSYDDETSSPSHRLCPACWGLIWSPWPPLWEGGRGESLKTIGPEWQSHHSNPHLSKSKAGSFQTPGRLPRSSLALTEPEARKIAAEEMATDIHLARSPLAVPVCPCTHTGLHFYRQCICYVHRCNTLHVHPMS